MSVLQQMLAGGGGVAPRVYATFNPDRNNGAPLSTDNLTFSPGWNGWQSCNANISKTSGKWYWEVVVTSGGGANGTSIGITNGSLPNSGRSLGNALDYSQIGFGDDGNVTQRSNIVTYSAYINATFGFELNLDGGTQTLQIYNNGSSLGPAFTFLSPLANVFPAVSGYGTTMRARANFGASAFSYGPSAGFNSGVYT